MFSFGKEFREIWVEIPKAETYQGCVDVIEKIEDYSTKNLITREDTMVLLDCLEAFIDARYAPKTREEWVEMYGLNQTPLAVRGVRRQPGSNRERNQ